MRQTKPGEGDARGTAAVPWAGGKPPDAGAGAVEAPEGGALRSWRLVRRRASELKAPPDGVREDYGDIEGLRSSIARQGLLSPVLIEHDGTVRGGARRLRAIRENAGAGGGRDDPEVECLLLPPGADPRVASLVENIQRKGLSPVEEARAFRRLLEATGWTQRRLAGELGVSASRVCLSLNLLRAPENLQAEVDSGRASADAVGRSYGRRGRALGRAERVRERVRSGKTVSARHVQPSVRVRGLPPDIRARCFTDRVELTFVLWDETVTLEAASHILTEIRKTLASSEAPVARALRTARLKARGLDGHED